MCGVPGNKETLYPTNLIAFLIMILNILFKISTCYDNWILYSMDIYVDSTRTNIVNILINLGLKCLNLNEHTNYSQLKI